MELTKLSYRELQTLAGDNDCYPGKGEGKTKKDLLNNLQELDKVDYSSLETEETEAEEETETGEETKETKRQYTRQELQELSKTAITRDGRELKDSLKFDVFNSKLITYGKTLEKRNLIFNSAYHGEEKNNNLSDIGENWKQIIPQSKNKNGEIFCFTAHRGQHFMLFIPYKGREINVMLKDGETAKITRDNFLNYYISISNIGRLHRMAKFYAFDYGLRWDVLEGRKGKVYHTSTNCYYTFNINEGRGIFKEDIKGKDEKIASNLDNPTQEIWDYLGFEIQKRFNLKDEFLDKWLDYETA